MGKIVIGCFSLQFKYDASHYQHPLLSWLEKGPHLLLVPTSSGSQPPYAREEINIWMLPRLILGKQTLYSITPWPKSDFNEMSSLYASRFKHLDHGDL